MRLSSMLFVTQREAPADAEAPVTADPGAIGGAVSEEFMVRASTGEDAIAACAATGYASNVERATSRIAPPPAAPERVPMHREPTPAARSCEDLRRLFPELPIERMLETVLYRAIFADHEEMVAVMVRGDRAINEVKLLNHLRATKVELADAARIRAATGAEPGFAGPIGLPPSVRLLADRSVEAVEGFLCGGNEADVHWLDVWFGRDLEQPPAHDLGLVQAGDRTPCGEGTLEITRGIEVGHVFQLGTKYSEAMGVRFANADGDLVPAWMGCYGIGVSRVAAAAIEQHHDAAGMIWPLAIAPYSVWLLQLRMDDEAQGALAAKLHGELEAAGVDVAWDDRATSPGAKFKDADLVGVPLRVVVGRDAAAGRVEWSPRTGRRETIDAAEAVERVCAAVRAICWSPSGGSRADDPASGIGIRPG